MLRVIVLAACLALAACGGERTPEAGPATGAPASSAAPASQAPQSQAPGPDIREITVTVNGRKVTPPPSRVSVPKGRVVRITVTSDRADTLHVHGYDLEAELPAGAPGSVQFSADRTGLFEVETHSSRLVLFQLAVQ